MLPVSMAGPQGMPPGGVSPNLKSLVSSALAAFEDQKPLLQTPSQGQFIARPIPGLTSTISPSYFTDLIWNRFDYSSNCFPMGFRSVCCKGNHSLFRKVAYNHSLHWWYSECDCLLNAHFVLTCDIPILKTFRCICAVFYKVP